MKMRLIDADALLQKFKDSGIQITFDLPVEEILGDDVDIDDFAMLVQDAVQVYKNMVIGTIKDMPTAYNVDKVVEEIKSLSGYEIYKNTFDLIIDIVRKGGVE